MTRPLLSRLSDACGGSCSCLTKTPNVEHHDEMCTYRLHFEALEMLHRFRFIDVAERLPEKDAAVLYVFADTVWPGQYVGLDEDSLAVFTGPYGWLSGDVTYWMAWPKAPGEPGALT